MAQLPATKPQIKRLSYRHERILDWLIANPQAPLAQCAAEFGVSQPWLSTIIHSDAFQARYRELSDNVHDEVTVSIHERLTGLAHIAIDKLEKKVEVAGDSDFILSATDKVLHRLGFAPTRGPAAAGAQGNVTNVQNNFYTADADALARARDAQRRAYSEPLRLEHEPTSGETPLGKDATVSAELGPEEPKA